MADKNLDVSAKINADAATLYGMVSELTQMGKWSPENRGGKWLGGATGPAAGARFKGSNKSGWRRWSTIATVTDADPGKKFGFEVTVGGVPIAHWCYEFDGDGTTTTVTERWFDKRPGWMESASAVLMGVPNRAEHNERNMQATLAALKTAAEAGS
jgi:hypothetical protein